MRQQRLLPASAFQRAGRWRSSATSSRTTGEPRPASVATDGTIGDRLSRLAPAATQCVGCALDRSRATIARMQVAIAQLDRDRRRPVRQRARILDALREAERAGADAGRHARAVALRLSARGPAAAAGLRRRVRARARGACRRSRADARSSSVFRERADGRRYNAVAVLRDGAHRARLSQAAAAELHGVRRGAVLRAGQRALRLRGRRRARRTRHLRGRLGAGTGRAGAAAGAQVLVVPNGSPYHTRSRRCGAQVVRRARARMRLPIVYVNRVGGQDELVFDGASFVVDAQRSVAQQLPAWHETLALVDFDGATSGPCAAASTRALERTCTRRWSWACATTSTRTGFPV